MQQLFRNVLTVLILLSAVACKPVAEDTQDNAEGELARVGSVSILQTDLDYHLQENHLDACNSQVIEAALAELVERARFHQAALDYELDKDPIVRAEVTRILANRLRETQLYPKIKAAFAGITEEVLRERYVSQPERFQSMEKRQVAVLWLNPGADPERAKAYKDKLTQARDWFLNESDLASQPELGFSVLSVDHSEHASTRFKGGVLGWVDIDGGSSDWSRVVAEAVFSLSEIGEISPVIIRPEGIFLVHWMALQPAVQSPFESVRAKLKTEEQARLKKTLELEFIDEIENR